MTYANPRWSLEFEDQALTAAGRAKLPDFPDKASANPRVADTQEEHAALATYYISAASHDLYIVQVVARALAQPYAQDFDLQIILSRQLGDDGFHAGEEKQWADIHHAVDPVAAINARVQDATQRLGDLPYRSLAGFIAFEFHYEVYELARLKLARRTGNLVDPITRSFLENRLVPDEEWHRIQVIEWWFNHLDAQTVEARNSLIQEVIETDNEIQLRLHDYLHEKYRSSHNAFGTQLDFYVDIYDGFRRRTLAALLDTGSENLPALRSLGDK
jgi:hypothetical protein